MKEKKEVGPIYGVELLDSLPIDGSSMRQALPSRQDLDNVRRTKINYNDRVVAGFEVLTEHYRRAMTALETIRDCAGVAAVRWDRDEDAKVGKILRCLAGELPGYMASIDEIHAMMKRAKL